MTDGVVCRMANRIYRYFVKIEKLPNAGYSAALIATREAEHRAKIDALVARIEASSHANGKKIAEIIRKEICDGKPSSIGKNIKYYLELPRNWTVLRHELMMSQDDHPGSKKVGRKTNAERKKLKDEELDRIDKSGSVAA